MKRILVLLATLLIVACVPAKSIVFEQYGEWQVTTINGNSWEGLHTPTIMFSGNSISGSGGCNRYQATLESYGETFAVGPTAATKMACPGSAAELENSFFAVLAVVNEARMDGDRLILENTREKVSMVLSRSQQ
ncbi:META domain-containing protein [uncultured Umboniibacter sp.]|uniref:META domain-containing protein n=1 Tax=uncultured Umboniibacter sp. TaxID=1798917 RepID=UPI00260BDC71|nr:META domain-containing protein [uncultured Umboniibacter sp.]